MSLCPACSRISVPNLTRELELELELDDLPPWLMDLCRKSNKARGMLHLHDARNLIASASGGCPFCGLIVQATLQEMKAVTDTMDPPLKTDQPSSETDERTLHQLQLHLLQQPIYLQTNYDPIKLTFPEAGVPGSWHIRGVKVFVPVDHLVVVVGRIRLYAARDSPAGASCNIIGRPPLSSSDSPEAFDLINRWMKACLSKHHVCRESLSGTNIDDSTPPLLPSRVISVGQPGSETSVRLLETVGRRGYYIALSHCWGPPSQRPLNTTQSTLPNLLNGIPWSSLPKLYQDVIKITQRLGFEYIWIDSLCIVQDSHGDWLNESQRMAEVYQHARLTVATSHAADSSQTCFPPRSVLPATVKLPNTTSSGRIEGYMFACVLSTDYGSITPEAGLLANRAWATQEWLLSRRMVFYTTGNLVWSCKIVSQRETGATFHSTARNFRWKNLIEKYSARELTKQTDRLVALEGIRSEMAKKRGHDIYCYGLWKNAMPDQLLWYCMRPGDRRDTELDLPSWTWASIMQGVRFLNTEGAKNVCDGYRFDEATGILIVRSVLRKVPVVTAIDSTENTLGHNPTFESAPFGIIWENKVFTFQLEPGFIAGWCALDESSAPSGDVYCLRLMGKTERTYANNTFGAKKTVYIESMLLVHSDDSDSKIFKRIGVCKLRTSTAWFKDSIKRPIGIR